MFRDAIVSSERMAKAATRKEHEAAQRYLTPKELCWDLAREHAARPEVRLRDQTTRRFEVALLLYCRSSGVTRVALILARRLALARTRRARRYEQIASELSFKRAKGLPLLQQIAKNKLKDEIERSSHEAAVLQRDLVAVFNDPSYTLERRREALRQLHESKDETDERLDRQGEALVGLSLSPAHYDASAIGLVRRRKMRGKEQFFARLDAVIRRYLAARENEAPWVNSMSLLHLLAMEWLRDAESLWDFLEGFYHRWEETSAPAGDHQQHLGIHNALEICPEATMRDVVFALEELGKLGRNDSGAHDRLRRRASRNIRDAKAHGIV